MPRDFYDRLEDGYVLATIRQGSGMTDLIERAQEREQADRELRLREHAESRQPGRATSTDCNGAISPARQALGAQRCIDHQTAFEQEARRRNARTAV